MLRFQDLEFREGKRYKDEYGMIWTLSIFGDSFFNEAKDVYLSSHYSEKTLATMTFEEVINWNLIPIDTPVLVQNEGNTVWYKRHFAKVGKNGKICTFTNGKTSFSCSDIVNPSYSYSDGDLIQWDIAKLSETMD